jgi:hypothetical protein
MLTPSKERPHNLYQMCLLLLVDISRTLIVYIYVLRARLFYRTFLANWYHYSQKEFHKKEMILVFSERHGLKLYF